MCEPDNANICPHNASNMSVMSTRQRQRYRNTMPQHACHVVQTLSIYIYIYIYIYIFDILYVNIIMQHGCHTFQTLCWTTQCRNMAVIYCRYSIHTCRQRDLPTPRCGHIIMQHGFHIYCRHCADVCRQISHNTMSATWLLYIADIIL